MSKQNDLFDSAAPQEINLPKAELTLWRHFLSDADIDLISLKNKLQADLKWQQSVIKMFGKAVAIPRLNAWYADPDCDYAYSGHTLQHHDWTPLLLELKHKIEATVGHTFNSVLANYYRDGNDGVGWHSDDERELGKNPVIASLSLGAPRRFLLKPKGSTGVESTISETKELTLTDGSLLLMAGTTQHFWQHSIPKERRIDAARINLTFRNICA
jgi:alkylated DNA repair dioxygenase AlkB